MVNSDFVRFNFFQFFGDFDFWLSVKVNSVFSSRSVYRWSSWLTTVIFFDRFWTAPNRVSNRPSNRSSLLLIPLKTWIWWATAILYYLTLFNCIYRENLPSGEECGNFTGSFYRGTFDGPINETSMKFKTSGTTLCILISYGMQSLSLLKQMNTPSYHR